MHRIQRDNHYILGTSRLKVFDDKAVHREAFVLGGHISLETARNVEERRGARGSCLTSDTEVFDYCGFEWSLQSDKMT